MSFLGGPTPLKDLLKDPIKGILAEDEKLLASTAHGKPSVLLWSTEAGLGFRMQGLGFRV